MFQKPKETEETEKEETEKEWQKEDLTGVIQTHVQCTKSMETLGWIFYYQIYRRLYENNKFFTFIPSHLDSLIFEHLFVGNFKSVVMCRNVEYVEC